MAMVFGDVCRFGRKNKEEWERVGMGGPRGIIGNPVLGYLAGRLTGKWATEIRKSIPNFRTYTRGTLNVQTCTRRLSKGILNYQLKSRGWGHRVCLPHFVFPTFEI